LTMWPSSPPGGSFVPVVLPAGWKSIQVERVWAHGEGRSLTAVAGAPGAILDGRRLRRAS